MRSSKPSHKSLALLALCCLILTGFISPASAQAAPDHPEKFSLSCQAMVMKPALFRQAYQQVMVFDGSPEYINIPAKLGWDERKIQIIPARHRYETVAAIYEDRVETIEVVRERTELRAIPATYYQTQRNVKTQAAHSRWKANCIGSLAECIEYVPDKYRTLMVQGINIPARIEQVRMPAKTIQIPRKVLVRAGRGTGKPLAAQYITVRLQHVDKPWEIRTSQRPSRYERVSINKLIHPSQIVETAVVCEESLSPTLITRLQQALRQQHIKLPISRQWDQNTRRALLAFQQQHALPTGGITLETLRKLELL